MSDAIDGLVTPVFIKFTDFKGRIWEALALVAPLRSEDEDPVQIAMAEDLELVPQDYKVVKRP